MKAILYCRKSTDTEDKQAMSLDAQEFELRKIAQRDGIKILDVYRESMSAKTFGRPFFNTMMQEVLNGTYDTILCWKIDRLSRNPTDSATLQTLLQQGQLQKIITYDRVYSSNDNVMILGIEQLMANQYIRDLSANVKRGNREKLRRGEWPNRAPYGYRNDKNTKTLKTVPSEAKKVLQTFEMYASGKYSFKQIADELGFPKSHVEHILNRTFYYGMMERQGEFFPGVHKPIISKELFDKAQEIKKGVTVTHAHPQKLFFPYRGLMRCSECSCQLTATIKKDKFTYYYCTNGKGFCTQYKNYLNAQSADSLFIEALEKIQFDEELVEIMYQAAREKLENGSYDTQKTLDALSMQLHSLKEQERKLLHSFTTGLIDEALFTEEAQKLATEKKTLTARYRNYSENAHLQISTLELTKQVFLDANKASFEFSNASGEKKRKLAQNLLWNLEVKDKKVANFNFKSLYQALANAPKSGDLTEMLPDLDSNQDNILQRDASYH